MKFFQAISRKGLLSTVVCMSAALTACSGGDKAATEEQAETAVKVQVAQSTFRSVEQ